MNTRFSALLDAPMDRLEGDRARVPLKAHGQEWTRQPFCSTEKVHFHPGLGLENHAHVTFMFRCLESFTALLLLAMFLRTSPSFARSSAGVNFSGQAAATGTGLSRTFLDFAQILLCR